MKAKKPRRPQQMQIVYRKIAELKRNPQNAKKHPKEQIEQLRAAYRKFGYINPLLLKPDDVIGAGHGRLDAAEAEGYEEVPTITLAGLSDDEWRALVLADNKIQMNGEWDQALLAAELGAIKGLGFDLGELGFGTLELGQLGVPGFALEERLDAAEETPEPPKVPSVARGELWLLDNHRLLIGDSTKPEDVARVLSGKAKDLVPVPMLMVTDPPYGVNYDPDWRNKSSIGWSPSISTGTVQNDGVADWREAYRLFPGDVAYVWHPPGARQVEFFNSLVATGLEIRMQIIWAKPHAPIGRGNYHVQHEPCWYCVRKGKTAHWNGSRKETTLWQIANFTAFRGGEKGPEDEKTGHGTQKPIECMRRPILNNSKRGDAVYDPFVGSGTTLIACEMEKRRCFAMEIDPAYAEVVIERWQKFTGKIATREDGKTLAQLKRKPMPLSAKAKSA